MERYDAKKPSTSTPQKEKIQNLGMRGYDYVLKNFNVKAAIWNDNKELIDDRYFRESYIKIANEQMEDKAKEKAEAKKNEEKEYKPFNFQDDDLGLEEEKDENLNEKGPQAEIGFKENNRAKTPPPTPKNDSRKREKKIVNPDEEITVLNIANDSNLDIRGNDGDGSNIEDCPESIDKPPVFEAYVKVSAKNKMDNGHSFLGFRFTLKEKGEDGRVVYQRKHICVGYAPDGPMIKQIFALTPAVMLRDTTHSATIGYQKEISYNQLRQLTMNIPEYFNEYPKYSLLKNNCNRFVRCMAKGINLPDIHSMYSDFNLFNAPKRSLKNMTNKFYEKVQSGEDPNLNLPDFVFNWASNDEKKYTTGMGGFRKERELDISREKFFDKVYKGSEYDMSHFTKSFVMPKLYKNMNMASRLSDDNEAKETLLKESRLNVLLKIFGSGEILDEISNVLHLLKTNDNDNTSSNAQLNLVLERVPKTNDVSNMDGQEGKDQKIKRYRDIISHLKNIVKISGTKHKQLNYFCMQTIERYKVLIDLQNLSHYSKTLNPNEQKYK